MAKLSGAEKFGITIEVDNRLNRNPNQTFFPIKLEKSKKMLSKIKRSAT